jgi:hypothetical protein
MKITFFHPVCVPFLFCSLRLVCLWSLHESFVLQGAKIANLKGNTHTNPCEMGIVYLRKLWVIPIFDKKIASCLFVSFSTCLFY